jgi:hypothetical protein
LSRLAAWPRIYGETHSVRSDIDSDLDCENPRLVSFLF